MLVPYCAALQDVSGCICTCFGIYRGIYTSWWLYSGAVGVVRGAILSAEALPIISQLAVDCVQSPIELRAAIASVN
jgi:energy-converting hydrogenase Eha subunit E